ncbi:MAG TPA: NAD(P)/FAD-dependent oxidoreductase [Candidatus Binatia bacterium]
MQSDASNAPPREGNAASRLPHVVIVGAGFGGLRAAQRLGRADVRVTVLDRRNHHLFQPLLYQVASAGLNPSDIAVPIRRILRRQRNTTVLLAEVQGIDLERKRVLLSEGEVAYDYLILAPGATDNYFGHDEWAEHAPSLKSLDEALQIRDRVLMAFEAAEREDDPQRRADWLTFVVIGAGPTGVELAGALTEIARHTLARDFRRFDPRQARVLLLEGGPRVLPTYSERSSASAQRQLESIGVEVRTSTMVTGIEPEGVRVGDELIRARTVLWAAGVKASPLLESLGVPLERGGRVRVERDLSLPGHPEVFVVGDAVAFEQDGALVPGVAPAAMQQGDHAARNVLRLVARQPTAPFRYVDKGSLATIGRAKAVAEIGRVRLSGLVAWLAWLGIHIFFLIGFRNRLLVLFEWAWAYVTYQRGARLITERVYEHWQALWAPDEKPPAKEPAADEAAARAPLGSRA